MTHLVCHVPSTSIGFMVKGSEDDAECQSQRSGVWEVFVLPVDHCDIRRVDKPGTTELTATIKPPSEGLVVGRDVLNAVEITCQCGMSTSGDVDIGGGMVPNP